jgi:hypothetical protein
VGAGVVCADAVATRKPVAIRAQASFLTMENLPTDSPWPPASLIHLDRETGNPSGYNAVALSVIGWLSRRGPDQTWPCRDCVLGFLCEGVRHHGTSGLVGATPTPHVTFQVVRPIVLVKLR